MAYTREEAAKLIIQAGLELVKRGLIARTWGNISARISESEFLITPSGMAYDRLTPDKLVVCKIEDCSYTGDIKPSSEKGVHGEAYKYRKDIHFVIHTHQLYATAVGAMNQAVTGRNEQEKQILGSCVPVAEYAISSTKALKKKVSACIQKHPQSNAFFMRYHGILALGSDYENAFTVAETLEACCRDMIVLQNKLDASAKTGFAEGLDEREILDAVQTIRGNTSLIFDASPAVCRLSETGKGIRPMIDDMAQIAGASFCCIDPAEGDMAKRIARGLRKNAVVFVKGLGAVCAADSEEEAEAVSMVLQKNALAAVYCTLKGNREHLKMPDALLQRVIYVKKYSKLK